MMTRKSDPEILELLQLVKEIWVEINSQLLELDKDSDLLPENLKNI